MSGAVPYIQAMSSNLTVALEPKPEIKVWGPNHKSCVRVHGLNSNKNIGCAVGEKERERERKRERKRERERDCMCVCVRESKS